MTSNRSNGGYMSRSPVGRPRSLPLDALERVLLHEQSGMSYRQIATELRNTLGIDVSRWTVRRVVLRLPPYERS
jgi:hypothetical protein